MAYFQAATLVTLSTGDIMAAGEVVSIKRLAAADTRLVQTGALRFISTKRPVGVGILLIEDVAPVSSKSRTGRLPGLADWYDGALSIWRWDPDAARRIEPLVFEAHLREQALIEAGRVLTANW